MKNYRPEEYSSAEIDLNSIWKNTGNMVEFHCTIWIK